MRSYCHSSFHFGMDYIKLFNQYSDFDSVSNIFNMVDKEYLCSQCEYKATQKGTLGRHIKSVHEGQKFQCPQCEYKTTWKGQLQIHIKSIHEGQKFQCPQCEYKATDNMGKSGSSHFRDPPLISEESPLKSEAVLIKYLDFWDR